MMSNGLGVLPESPSRAVRDIGSTSRRKPAHV